MAQEATVDAYDEYEQLDGFYAAISDHLAMSFETVVLGVRATVNAVGLRSDGRIVAGCSRGRHRQAIGILDLPLPAPAPGGDEWIEAYRHWAP